MTSYPLFVATCLPAVKLVCFQYVLIGSRFLARAVRFVRKNAEIYGIDEKDIAVMGFSAGGILAGEMLLNFSGTVDGTALDSSYIPDELDQISADAGADGMIYSFYGRLSVASTDVEKFSASDLPPTYFLLWDPRSLCQRI